MEIAANWLSTCKWEQVSWFLVIFVAMRNYYQYITVLVCSLLALLQAGKFPPAQAAPAATTYKENSSAIATSKHTRGDLEINSIQWSNASSSSFRMQGSLGFLPFLRNEIHTCIYIYGNILSGKTNHSFKEYLVHIYPSHNFW